MTNQLWGCLTLAASSCIFYASYTSQKRNNYLIAILLLMIGGFILRLFTACDFFLHPWDEVYHAVVAKHMIHHPLSPTLYEFPVLPYDYSNWSGNHIWLHKQPLPLWTMAASMYLFGVNEIALRLPSVLLTTIGIALTYYIGSFFFDRRTGYLAAFFYAINGLIIEMAAGRVPTDHIDDFFLFFIELAIAFTIAFVKEKKLIYNILVGISIGAAILSKWLPALIVLPIWILLIIDSKKFSWQSITIHFAILILVFIAISLPWQLYIRSKFPVEYNIESGYNIKHITQILDHQGGPFYFYLDKIRINYGELVYLPLIWFVIISIKNIFNFRQLSLLLWASIPILFFSFIKTKMQGYILFASPSIFLISAGFWFEVYAFKSQINTAILKLILNLLLILMLLLPIRYSIERIKPFQNNRIPQWVEDLKNINTNRASKTILFNYDRPIDVMFYTDITSYKVLPDYNKIENLANQGYTIFIYDDENLPEYIKSTNKIKIIHITTPKH